MRNKSWVGAFFVVALVGCVDNAPPSESEEEVAQTSDALASVSTIKLKSKLGAKFWTGVVNRGDAPLADAPPECAGVPCDHVRIKVELPNGTFNNPNKPGGVQVALRWFGVNPGHQLPPDVPGCCGEFDTLHLFVYKDGDLVAASPGIIATAQSALIPSPENGYYDVWIAFDPDYNVADYVEYEALTEVEFQPNVQPAKTVLPDLEFRSTERITFDSPSFPIFEPDPPPGSTCFTSETEEDGAQVCLRFDQIVANIGTGPVEIEHTVPPGAEVSDGTEFPVSQRVYNSDGSYADRDAGTVEFHDTHGHFHYSSFANSQLWASNASGALLGSAPIRGQQKVSFCMADIRIDKWGEKGDGPRTYFAPDCLFPASSDENGDHFKQGIENGWADVYDWYIPDQYIEVSGVPDGYYVLRMCADPFDEIQEADEGNNCISNLLHLADVDSPNRSVQMLGTVPEPSDGSCGGGHGAHGHGHGHH